MQKEKEKDIPIREKHPSTEASNTKQQSPFPRHQTPRSWVYSSALPRHFLSSSSSSSPSSFFLPNQEKLN
jgi:hypothetical protein